MADSLLNALELLKRNGGMEGDRRRNRKWTRDGRIIS